MKKIAAAAFLAAALAAPSIASAHFGMVIPSAPTVMENKDADIRLDLKFWHPFENIGMNLAKPKVFQLWRDGQAEDLLPQLKEGREQGQEVWSLDYKLTRPGLYAFAMEPSPYFEKEEDCFIIHYTKVYVDAFGDDEGWDAPLGLAAEIVPLSRPGALYAGNVFQGRVFMGGQAVKNAEVEVEWYPGPDKRGQAPNAGMVTQSVRADENGVFTFAAPRAGWWGFAALGEADYKIKEGGEDKAVEIGAVFWAYFHEPLPALPLEKSAE